MEGFDSLFIYQEREQDLRQKLVDATLELETMKNVKTELFNLLNTAYQERDEAKTQLQKLTNLQDTFVQSLLMFPSTKTNPSITESSSLSHGSPPVDSFFDTVSSPEFSNNNNIGYLNHHHQHQHQHQHQQQQQHHLVQDFNYLMVPSEKSMCDPATAVIDCLARERVLPQKGKLLQAVIDAGPLLQTILLAGPLPTWRNPPPLQDIKVPPLSIKECCATTSIEPNSFSDSGNAFLKPKVSPLLLQSSNAPSTCSASMLNFAGNPPHSWNNSRQFSSSSSVRIQVPPRKRQRHQ